MCSNKGSLNIPIFFFSFIFLFMFLYPQFCVISIDLSFSAEPNLQSHSIELHKYFPLFFENTVFPASQLSLMKHKHVL